MRATEEYLKVLDETIEFYSADISRRAVSESGNCRYLTADGRMCAVGRCLEDPSTAMEGIGVDAVAVNAFKKEFRGFHIDFWQDLQEIHDTDYIWGKEGLTEAGKRRVDSLKLKITKGFDNV